MEGPRQIDGAWWQQSGDARYQWNTGEQKWEQKSAAPPRSFSGPRTTPAAAAVATIESRPEVDAKDPG